MGGRGSSGGSNGVVLMDIEAAKHYSRVNPYDHSGQSADEVKSSEAYMRKLEQTLREKGWKAFKNKPVLEVGESGQHAVISDGNHRVWAAAKIGMKKIPVAVVTGEDDAWAKRYGFKTEKNVESILKRRKRGKK